MVLIIVVVSLIAVGLCYYFGKKNKRSENFLLIDNGSHRSADIEIMKDQLK